MVRFCRSHGKPIFTLNQIKSLLVEENFLELGMFVQQSQQEVNFLFNNKIKFAVWLVTVSI